MKATRLCLSLPRASRLTRRSRLACTCSKDGVTPCTHHPYRGRTCRMMNELVTAAKDSLGLRSIWIDDEDYELIINAVLMKVAGYDRSEEHTSELQSLMRISYAVFCLNKQNT